MNKTSLLVGISVLIPILAIVGYLAYILTPPSPKPFIDKAITQLRSGSGPETIYEVITNDGFQATAIMEHSCCSGAGFDVVVIRLSDGREFISYNNYCGIEGLPFQREYNSINDLLTILHKEDFTPLNHKQ